MVEVFLLFVAAHGEVKFLEIELAHGELVVLFCAVGFGLFALAAVFFAFCGALGFGAIVDVALGLAFFALLFSQLAAGLRGDIALFS